MKILQKGGGRGARQVRIDEDVRDIVQYTRAAVAGLRWEPVVFWKAHIYRKECTVLLQRSAEQSH